MNPAGTTVALQAERGSGLALDPLAPRPAPAAGGERASLQRAHLAVYEGRPGGGGELGAPSGRIEFQFNPRELSVHKSATWTRKPARAAEKAPPPEFTGAEAGKMSFELLFDAAGTRDGSVVAAVESLLACCVPTEGSRAQGRPLPPLVVLQWGQTRGFAAYVTQVGVRYTLFSPAGNPLRATCSVSLEEMPGVKLRQNPTSGARTAHRVHVLVAGDSLASVAYREYGDPAAWRALARCNGIDDPMRLRPGTSLLVPAPDELEAG